MPIGKDSAEQKQDVTDDFLYWIKVARDVVTDHFPAERSEPHNLMVIDTARTLMLADRLGAIDTTLEGIQRALETSKES